MVFVNKMCSTCFLILELNEMRFYLFFEGLIGKKSFFIGNGFSSQILKLKSLM